MVSGSVLAVVLASLAQAAPVPAEQGGFKFIFRELDVAGRKLHNGEIIVQGGRWYRIRNIDNEIVIVDPKRRRVEVIDLTRKTQSDVSFARLEDRTALLKKTLRESVAKREAEGGRANKVAAKMAADLIEPGFKPARDDGGKNSKLKNESVEIDANGESDVDPKRVEEIGLVLSTLTRLESLRNPERIPPFAELEAIREVTANLKLRPTEIVYVFRLAGKPIKQRWTYQFVPSLTDREKAAIGRIIEVQGLARSQRFESYEKDKQ